MSKHYSKSSNGKKSSKGKRIFKMLAMFLAGLLLGTMLVTSIGVFANGFDSVGKVSWFDKKPNPDNLIKVDDNYIVTQDTSRGVKIKVNETNGEIKLTGTATSAHQVTVQTVTLQPGTYKISGMKDVNLDQCYLGATVDGVSYLANVEGQDTFTLPYEDEVTLYISWVKDYSFGAFGMKVLPEIVAVSE